MANRSIHIGDEVIVINETLTGVVVRFVSKKIIVLCNDGFKREYGSKDIIHKGSLDQYLSSDKIPDKIESISAQMRNKNLKNYSKWKSSSPPEIDLHIQKLLKSHKGMSNFEILELQLKSARNFLDEAISKKTQRIIIIHGVGEGVLKKELVALFNKYKVIYEDASFQKYGRGATEIYISQNRKGLGHSIP